MGLTSNTFLSEIRARLVGNTDWTHTSEPTGTRNIWAHTRTGTRVTVDRVPGGAEVLTVWPGPASDGDGLTWHRPVSSASDPVAVVAAIAPLVGIPERVQRLGAVA